MAHQFQPFNRRRSPRLNFRQRPKRRSIKGQHRSLQDPERPRLGHTAGAATSKQPGPAIEARQQRRRRLRQQHAEFEAGLRRIDQEPAPKQKGILRRLRSVLRRSLQITAVLGVITAGFIGFKLFSAAQSAIVERGAGALGLQEDIDPNQLKGEGDGRVNILLIGIGGKGHPGGTLSDVIMVASVDPVNNQAAMLSIPRDLYMTIPGYYATRINEAYFLGDNDPNTTGENVVEASVEKLLGVDIHYFARIDFDGFVKVVDRLGGITVEVEETLYDNSIESAYGAGYSQPFSLSPGEHHLDGALALQYVRCRKGTCGNDFGRARRQQQLLQAVRDKVLSLGTFSNPLKINDILDTVRDHFRTNVQISEGLRMLEIAQHIDKSSVESAVLDNKPDGLLASQSVNGASVLVPRAGIDNFTDIQRYVRGELFADGFIRKENAAIAILNATTTPGLAAELQATLEGLGYRVEYIGDAPDKGQANTQLYDNTQGQAPFTVKLLEKRLQTTVQGTVPPSVHQAVSADVIVLLGNDYANRTN